MASVRKKKNNRQRVAQAAREGSLPFDKASYVRDHLAFRAPPPWALRYYLSSLGGVEGQALRILDVGAGTGHFSIPIAKALPRATIVALEPSSRMLQCIRSRARAETITNVSFVESTLQQFRGERSFDVIFLSEAIHLFPDTSNLVALLKANLAADGRLLFRTSTHAQLATREWYDYFPAARLADMQRHPSIELLECILRANGFHVFSSVVDESRPVAAEQFYEMFRKSVFSTLTLIPQRERREGLRKLRRSLLNQPTIHFDYQMSLIVAIGDGMRNTGVQVR